MGILVVLLEKRLEKCLQFTVSLQLHDIKTFMAKCFVSAGKSFPDWQHKCSFFRKKSRNKPSLIYSSKNFSL